MMAMDPEERFERIERSLGFIAANQAQHDARMAEIINRQAEHARQLEEHFRVIEANSGQIGQLGDLTLRVGRIVEEQARRMDRTDERLNTLISVVERYFSNGKK